MDLFPLLETRLEYFYINSTRGSWLCADDNHDIHEELQFKIPYRQAQSYQQKSSQKLKFLENLINFVPNNILLVEDDDYNQKIIKKYLLELGCKQIRER